MDQILDLWRMALRRFWIIAIVLVAGLPLVLLYAYLKLPLYMAEAKILVENQRIPDELARSTVTMDAGQRLQLIQQRLMARDNLVGLIQELGLYTDRDDLTLTQKVGLVRRATEFVPVSTPGRGGYGRNKELSAFLIRVTHESPTKAAELADRFVTVVLDQNIQSRSEEARETTAFFAQAQEQLNREIIALEEKITRFKEANKDALPESLAFRQAELSRIGDARLLLEQQLLGLEEERRTIQSRLEFLERHGAPAAALSAEELELRKLESALILQQATKAETHPEIQALKNRIAALKEAIARKNPGAGEGPAMGAEEAAMRNRLVLIDGQVTLLKGQKVKLEERRAELIATLQRTPGIEIQLNALERKLTEKQDAYSGYTRKRAEAEAGERMEVNQQAERFEVIESPIVPQYPIAPNRKKIVVMGSGLVVALALGLAFLVEQMRPRIRSAGQLERQLGLRPVVTLPHVRTRAERRQRLAWRSGVAALVLLGIPAGLYAVDRHYEPLPLLMAKLAEKSGANNILRMIEKRF